MVGVVEDRAEVRRRLGIGAVTAEHVARWPRFVRSNHEETVIAALDSLGVAWEYEPAGSRLPAGGTYVPDLWLPELGTYLECKSGDRAYREEKFTAFAEHVGRHGLELLVVHDDRTLHAAEDGHCGETRRYADRPWCERVDWVRCAVCAGWQPNVGCLHGWDVCRRCAARLGPRCDRLRSEELMMITRA